MNAYYLIVYGTPLLILYAYRALHITSKEWNKSTKWPARALFLLASIFVYASTTYIAVNRDTYRENDLLMDYALVGAITLSITLVCIALFQLMADLVLLGRSIVFNTNSKRNNGKTLSRRTFLNKTALAVGGVMLGSFLWGTTKGKFGWRIIKNKLAFDNLPLSFDGLKVVQISDLHLGSFHKNFEPLKEAIELINDLKADYIVFTGDLINENPDEAKPWINILKQLKAKQGKFAVLGNHDYGWGRISEDDKIRNSKSVTQIIREMDFQVLLNEHRVLKHKGEKIALVGVENWGYSEENWFPTKGDYKKSVEGMEDVPFKILLSHDPTHWDHQILDKESVDLTLAGHTHGGQMGISIPGLGEYNMAKMFYDRSAGLYSEGKQHLYVNRGLGYLIFPGRVGMPPEITLHVLNKA
ncbi:MAG: metallophosphoesterase [Bacteroidia bacterium]|nr:metallophosphoesterase [Bacteroidia bacterium]